jgi:hypothetical protein
MINISVLIVIYLTGPKSFGPAITVPCVRLIQFGQKHRKFLSFVLELNAANVP